jgi:hypothetical protein
LVRASPETTPLTLTRPLPLDVALCFEAATGVEPLSAERP